MCENGKKQTVFYCGLYGRIHFRKCVCECHCKAVRSDVRNLQSLFFESVFAVRNYGKRVYSLFVWDTDFAFMFYCCCRPDENPKDFQHLGTCLGGICRWSAGLCRYFEHGDTGTGVSADWLIPADFILRDGLSRCNLVFFPLSAGKMECGKNDICRFICLNGTFDGGVCKSDSDETVFKYIEVISENMPHFSDTGGKSINLTDQHSEQISGHSKAGNTKEYAGYPNGKTADVDQESGSCITESV